MYNQNLAVADMNADGFKEVFAPMNGHYITGLDRRSADLRRGLRVGFVTPGRWTPWLRWPL